MNWQSIDTAPRQGHCLGYDPHLTSPIIIVWNVRKKTFVAPDGFGDETPTHWQPLPPLEEWQPIETAPKGKYLLGFDPVLKRPYVMIWNVPGALFACAGGGDGENATLWLPLPEVPTPVSRWQRAA